MLKAVAGDLLIFGLSEMNLTKLREGRPIDVDLAELGLSGHVIIFYGETEAHMRRELAEWITTRTEYKDTTKKDDA